MANLCRISGTLFENGLIFLFVSYFPFPFTVICLKSIWETLKNCANYVQS